MVAPTLSSLVTSLRWRQIQILPGFARGHCWTWTTTRSWALQTKRYSLTEATSKSWQNKTVFRQFTFATDDNLSIHFKVCDAHWQEGDPTGKGDPTGLRGRATTQWTISTTKCHTSFYYLDIPSAPRESFQDCDGVFDNMEWFIERAIVDDTTDVCRGHGTSWAS